MSREAKTLQLEPLRYGHTPGDEQQGTFVDVLTLVETRLLLTASSGKGKSHTLRKLLELTYGIVQHIILDVEGEFHTLRAQHTYLVVGGPHGDIPLEVAYAEQLALEVLRTNANVIIDLFGMDRAKRYEFVAKFCTALADTPQELWDRNCLVVVDEAHKLAPQKINKGASLVAACKEAIITLAEAGRKRGLCIVLATQRFAKLDKDAAAECENKLIGGLNWSDDRQAAVEEIAPKDQWNKLKEALRTLVKGNFYAVGPAFGFTDATLVRIDDVITPHLKRGQRVLKYDVAQPDKIRAMVDALKEIPKEVKRKQDELQSLRNEVARLKAQPVVQAAPKVINVPQVVKVVNLDAVKKAYKVGYKDGRGSLANKLAGHLANIQQYASALSKAFAAQNESLELINTNALVMGSEKIFPDDKDIPDLSPAALAKIQLECGLPPGTGLNDMLADMEQPKHTHQELAHDASKGNLAQTLEGNTQFDAGDKRILGFLSLRPGIYFTGRAIANNSNFTATGGTFDRRMRNLLKQGLIQNADGGQSYSPNATFALPVGNIGLVRDILGPDYQAPTNLEARMAKLNDKERAIVTVLRQVRTSIHKMHIADHIHMAEHGGAFDKYLRHVVQLGLVDRNADGTYQYSKELAAIA